MPFKWLLKFRILAVVHLLLLLAWFAMLTSWFQEWEGINTSLFQSFLHIGHHHHLEGNQVSDASPYPKVLGKYYKNPLNETYLAFCSRGRKGVPLRALYTRNVTVLWQQVNNSSRRIARIFLGPFALAPPKFVNKDDLEWWNQQRQAYPLPHSQTPTSVDQCCALAPDLCDSFLQMKERGALLVCSMEMPSYVYGAVHEISNAELDVYPADECGQMGSVDRVFTDKHSRSKSVRNETLIWVNVPDSFSFQHWIDGVLPKLAQLDIATDLLRLQQNYRRPIFLKHRFDWDRFPVVQLLLGHLGLQVYADLDSTGEDTLSGRFRGVSESAETGEESLPETGGHSKPSKSAGQFFLNTMAAESNEGLLQSSAPSVQTHEPSKDSSEIMGSVVEPEKSRIDRAASEISSPRYMDHANLATVSMEKTKAQDLVAVRETARSNIRRFHNDFKRPEVQRYRQELPETHASTARQLLSLMAESSTSSEAESGQSRALSARYDPVISELSSDSLQRSSAKLKDGEVSSKIWSSNKDEDSNSVSAPVFTTGLYICNTPPLHPVLWLHGQQLLGVSVHKPSRERRRIIYLSRSRGGSYNGGRRVLNEVKLLRGIRRWLTRHRPDMDLEIFDHSQLYTYTHLREYFADVVAMIGPHGGAFTNMIFLTCNSVVVEFFPVQDSWRPPPHHRYTMYMQATLLDLSYWMIPTPADYEDNMDVSLSSVLKILNNEFV